MGVNTTNLTQSATITDAEFRLICQFIGNLLESSGVLLVADSGDMDNTTVTWPGSNGTAGGYEIRRFSDALQATAPIYIKIEYGRGGAAGQFAMWFTFGTGSNGAGTITGEKLARTAQLTLNTATATKAAWISAATNRFCFALGVDATTGGFISVERTLDTSKAVTNAGILFARKTSSAAVMTHQFINYQGTNPAESTTGGCNPPSAQTTGLHGGGNVATYPCFFFGIGETLVPPANFQGAFTTDFTASNQYTVSVLGSNQNMVCLPAGGAWGLPRGVSGGATPTNANFTMLMRYD